MKTDNVENNTAVPSDERLRQLKELFPECFSEGVFDAEKLHKILNLNEVIGGVKSDKTEKYRFNCASKREAIRLLGIPTRPTLKPCQHESPNFNDTSNLFSEGDNLEVLKRLYKPYFGRIKVSYPAPPYNTLKDFVYPDNYAAPLESSLQLTGQKDSKGNRQTRDGGQSFLKGGASC